MQSETLQTPVAFFVFKRPGTTRRVFEAISKVRPTKLLLIADGPRQDREGEAEACRQARDIVARVDWPCEVFRNFSESNLGCEDRIISGLNSPSARNCLKSTAGMEELLLFLVTTLWEDT